MVETVLQSKLSTLNETGRLAKILYVFGLKMLRQTIAFCLSLSFLLAVGYSGAAGQDNDGVGLQDLRSAAMAQAEHYASNSTFVTCKTSAACISLLEGLKALHPDTKLVMIGDPKRFVAMTSNPADHGQDYYWDSFQGGQVDTIPDDLTSHTPDE